MCVCVCRQNTMARIQYLHNNTLTFTTKPALFADRVIITTPLRQSTLKITRPRHCYNMAKHIERSPTRSFNYEYQCSTKHSCGGGECRQKTTPSFACVCVRVRVWRQNTMARIPHLHNNPSTPAANPALLQITATPLRQSTLKKTGGCQVPFRTIR